MSTSRSAWGIHQERPTTPALSGPCLTRQHERCTYSPCACDCHTPARPDKAASDRSTIEGHKAAPVASGGLTTNPTQAERRLGSW